MGFWETYALVNAGPVVKILPSAVLMTSFITLHSLGASLKVVHVKKNSVDINIQKILNRPFAKNNIRVKDK